MPRSPGGVQPQTGEEEVIENWVRQYEGDPEFEFDLLAIDVGERIVERMEL